MNKSNHQNVGEIGRVIVVFGLLVVRCVPEKDSLMMTFWAYKKRALPHPRSVLVPNDAPSLSSSKSCDIIVFRILNVKFISGNASRDVSIFYIETSCYLFQIRKTVPIKDRTSR